MKQQSIGPKLKGVLAAAGAVLKRDKKHLVYGLPNGKNVVVSSTPSDCRAENNAVREVKKAAGLAPAPKAARTTERRPKPGRQKPAWTLTRAEMGRESIHTTTLLERITEVERERDVLQARLVVLRQQVDDERGVVMDMRATRWWRLGRLLRAVPR